MGILSDPDGGFGVRDEHGDGRLKREIIIARILWVLGISTVVGIGVALPVGEAHLPLLTQGLSPIKPGRKVRSEDCTGCHKTVAAQWRGSQHATAATDPIFGQSWRNWPKAWCLNCHMPLEADQVAAFSAVPDPAHVMGARELHGEGVGCVACHVRDGRVLTPSRPSFVAKLFHELREEPALAESSFCAGCHQFNFQRHTPNFPFSYGEEPLQNTYREWEASGAAAAGRRCQDCHMPEGAHTFPGAHSLALLQRSLSVRARRVSDGLEVTVSAESVGHKVPTGDPFRRLVVELLEGGEVVVEHILKRRYGMDDESWYLMDDSTLPVPLRGLDTSRTWTLDVPGAPNSWRLWMVYGDPRFEGQLEPHQVRQLVAEGAVE
jgi:hypothetical protein